ncbi:MAG: hypothetical protein MUF75_01395 [Bacteroidia bacterium]|jgi:hypothetical protein|nr:hypothetical protein [Bacteroidia bacterium]
MKKFIYAFLLLTGTALFYSCGDSQKNEELVDEEHTPSIDSKKVAFSAQNVFNTLPDKELVLSLIEKNNLEYNPDFLNDPNLVTKYNIEFFKAINLGIYGSDLTISSTFDQTQESMVFLKCVNVLAGNLGVNAAFDQRMFDRIQSNDNNKDSVLQIITESFKKVDEILKNNNRPGTSAIILAGCWIEGLYVSCQMAQVVSAESIFKTILSQKESLHNLLALLESVELKENELFLVKDLRELHKIYEVAETSTSYDKAAIAGISQKISDLRKNVVSATS